MRNLPIPDNGITSSIKSVVMLDDSKWRRHGEARRKALILQDEIEGNVAFAINKLCRIQRYFEVADRVLKQFRSMYSSKRNPEEIYVMGCRLVSFLSEALPKHPQYHSADAQIKSLREKSLDQLSWIQERVGLIALRIDEAELNQFILDDLESSSITIDTRSEKHIRNETCSFESLEELIPTRDQPSPSPSFHKNNNANNTTHTTSSSTTSDVVVTNNSAWEDFSGWPQQVSFQPHEAETSNVFSEVSFDIDEDDCLDGGTAFPNGSPQRQYNFLFGDERDHVLDSTYELDLSGSILNTLAYQDVRYETDSEAQDSWAQDTETSFQSHFSNPHVTYNGARLAFDEIMKQVRSSSSLSSSSSTTVPTSSPSFTENQQNSTTENICPPECNSPNDGGWDLIPASKPCHSSATAAAAARSATAREAASESVLGIAKFSTGVSSSPSSDDGSSSSMALFDESSFDVFDLDPKSIIHQEWVSFDSVF
mmetsp:Transcript_25177/g.35470  ORF Transcript_25177/g.35470 Transcript_25177/m.35470 type:complete len:482 (-) Transcript_25177:243-1688(-)